MASQRIFFGSEEYSLILLQHIFSIYKSLLEINRITERKKKMMDRSKIHSNGEILNKNDKRKDTSISPQKKRVGNDKTKVFVTGNAVSYSLSHYHAHTNHPFRASSFSSSLPSSFYASSPPSSYSPSSSCAPFILSDACTYLQTSPSPHTSPPCSSPPSPPSPPSSPPIPSTSFATSLSTSIATSLSTFPLPSSSFQSSTQPPSSTLFSTFPSFPSAESHNIKSQISPQLIPSLSLSIRTGWNERNINKNPKNINENSTEISNSQSENYLMERKNVLHISSLICLKDRINNKSKNKIESRNQRRDQNDSKNRNENENDKSGINYDYHNSDNNYNFIINERRNETICDYENVYINEDENDSISGMNPMFVYSNKVEKEVEVKSYGEKNVVSSVEKMTNSMDNVPKKSIITQEYSLNKLTEHSLHSPCMSRKGSEKVEIDIKSKNNQDNNIKKMIKIKIYENETTMMSLKNGKIIEKKHSIKSPKKSPICNNISLFYRSKNNFKIGKCEGKNGEKIKNRIRIWLIQLGVTAAEYYPTHRSHPTRTIQNYCNQNTTHTIQNNDNCDTIHKYKNSPVSVLIPVSNRHLHSHSPHNTHTHHTHSPQYHPTHSPHNIHTRHNNYNHPTHTTQDSNFQNIYNSPTHLNNMTSKNFYGVDKNNDKKNNNNNDINNGNKNYDNGYISNNNGNNNQSNNIDNDDSNYSNNCHNSNHNSHTKTTTNTNKIINLNKNKIIETNIHTITISDTDFDFCNEWLNGVLLSELSAILSPLKKEEYKKVSTYDNNGAIVRSRLVLTGSEVNVRSKAQVRESFYLWFQFQFLFLLSFFSFTFFHIFIFGFVFLERFLFLFLLV